MVCLLRLQVMSYLKIFCEYRLIVTVSSIVKISYGVHYPPERFSF